MPEDLMWADLTAIARTALQTPDKAMTDWRSLVACTGGGAWRSDLGAHPVRGRLFAGIPEDGSDGTRTRALPPRSAS